VPVEYVVKYRRPGSIGAAALISEVVSYALLERLQIRTLSVALVRVSAAFSHNYARRKVVDYEVLEGMHFGTVYRPDLETADPRAWTHAFWDRLADPAELVALWVADSRLMNLDRTISGNILPEADPRGQVHLIAADQSDCFLGAGALADGSCFIRSRGHGVAPYLPLLEQTFLQLGVEPLRQMIQRIRGVREALAQAVSLVSEEWWRQASVVPQAVVDCLAERADRIEQIVELEKWEGIADVIRGGRQLGL
jgi:hypothetical protein